MVDLNHQIPIPASAARVFAAVATSEGNRGWWTADSLIDAREGGRATFGFERRAAVFHMTVLRVVADRELVMSCQGDSPEWKGTTLSYRIEQQGAETTLRFTHSGRRAMNDYCASCNSMWGRLMFRIQDYVESGKASPQWRQ